MQISLMIVVNCCINNKLPFFMNNCFEKASKSIKKEPKSYKVPLRNYVNFDPEKYLAVFLLKE